MNLLATLTHLLNQLGIPFDFLAKPLNQLLNGLLGGLGGLHL